MAFSLNRRVSTRAAWAASLGVLSLAGPALADDFSRGCELYNAKNYAQAEPLLSETVRKFPKFWPGHYYLAHTLLAEGKKGPAKREYEAVAGCSPAAGADILSACQKVIATLNGGGSAGGTSTASAGGSGGSASVSGDKDEEKAAPVSPQAKEKAAQMERLQHELQQKMEALREEKRERVAAAQANANQWYRYPDGSIKTALTPAEEQSLEQEFQEKMTRLQNDYKHRMQYLK